MRKKRLLRSYRKNNRVRKITLRNHRHAIKPMSGLTSIPLRFRGRRIS